MSLSARLQALWWRPQPPPPLLRPLAALYGAVADARAAAQRDAARRLPVPVIVVGNIAVGGTGKTPVTLALAALLRELGRRPGVIARGYGGRGPFPLPVDAGSDPAAAGDEPVLIARRGALPVAVAPDRHAAGLALVQAHPEVDVLLCDDGLQHYRLARDLELCVIDGARGHGNGWRLPAGPLREPPARAAACALQLVNGGEAAPYGDRALRFDLVLDAAESLADGRREPLAAWRGRAVHAVAGIGHPARFFAALRAAGLQVEEHAFADHHAYRAADLAFGDDRPVLMTEKDAVKCRAFAEDRRWAVPAALRFHGDAENRVRQCLRAALDAWRPTMP